MKTKKREKQAQTPQSEEASQTNLEVFLQAFKKPTQIYRYLRTRSLVSPFMLQRNLFYMKHRRSAGNAKRKTFQLNSLYEKIEQQPKTDVQTQDTADSGEPEYLKLQFEGFFDKHVSSETREVEVEAILTKISHHRKKDDGSSPVTQTSLGKVKVPVNPSSPSSHTIVVSKNSFRSSNGQIVQSCILHLSVTCHQQQVLPNGTCSPESTETDEPQSKRRRTGQTSKPVQEEEEEDVIVYGADLSVFDKYDKCDVKNGDYELILRELGSRNPSKNDSVWETAYNGKLLDQLEVFNSCPTLKFSLSRTQTSDNRCSPVPSEFLSNNSFSNRINFSGFNMESAMLKLKAEGQSTPQKKVHVTYQFLYNDNTRQQTDTRDNLHCPWCSLGCGRLHSLLKHLRLSHARFNFLYVPHQKGARIDVSINDRYDGSYAGNPQDINSYLGYAFSRTGPVRRTPYTHVIVYRPKRVDQGLLEFLEPESENQCSRQIVQGHNRLYYHTETCLPLQPQDISLEKDEDSMPNWLKQKSVNMIDEFSDVNEGEKELMKLWNLHCMKYSYIADCQISSACQKFVEEHGKEIIEKKICDNFLLHSVNLFHFGLIHPDVVQRTMWQLRTLQDELEQSAQLHVSQTIKQEQLIDD